MKVQTYKAYTPDGRLDLPLATLAPRFIQSIDRFKEYLLARIPQRCASILDSLIAHTSEWTPAQNRASDSSIRDQLAKQSGLRQQEPTLVRSHLALLLGLMDVDDAAWIQTQPTSVLQSHFIRSRYLPNYLKLLALTDRLPREDAIELMKAFLDWSIEQMPVREGGPENLTALRELQVAFNLHEEGMNWTSAVLGEHQYLNKVTRCRIRDVLIQQGDSELMDVVACYPDFAMFRHTNPSFVLTRTQTLMSGGDCCDSCYHDSRYVEAFQHPSSSVFGDLPS